MGGAAPAKNNIARLATPVEIKFIDYNRFKVSHTLLKKRANFIASGVSDYFASSGIDVASYEPLANGGESLVLDCSNGYVVKIQTGKGYQAPKSDLILEAKHKSYSKELNTSFAIFEKVSAYTSNRLEVSKMAIKLACEGIFMTDVNIYNFGYREDKNKPILIDAGAARELKYPSDLFALGINVLVKPVYQNMPFIHKPWRAFKKTMHEDFNIGPKPIVHPKPIKLDL